MVNQWIESAHERGASDIHFEPDKDDKVRVRMRVDGDLRTIEVVPDGRKVIARLKVMAGLDVNERGVPLDGRIKFSSSGGGRSGLDLRLSTNPCLGGEKVVLRLIDSSKLGMTLEDLGFTKAMLAAYKPLVASPTGLLLHVGPTGSGKTTSLYAVLNTINRPEINIQTVEDPVEYDVPGITQTQVNHEAGLTFPRVLRALLRQDPDVILVGEIRDHETGEIAVEAAMTGHLVLSTLHTNDAVGTVVRLVDMGIPPYAIAYALRSVISQRFARKLCERCRRSVQPPEPVIQMTGSNRPIYKAEGCKSCSRDGYDGRTPILEFLPMTEPLKRAIYGGATPDVLGEVAARTGMISLWDDGCAKMWAGLTSFEEVLRLTKGHRGAQTGAARRRAEHTARHAQGAPPPQAGPGARPVVRPAAARPPGAPAVSQPPRKPAR